MLTCLIYDFLLEEYEIGKSKLHKMFDVCVNFLSCHTL